MTAPGQAGGRTRHGLWALGVLGLALFAGHAGLGFDPVGQAGFEALYVALYLIPAGLCLARGALIRDERAPWILLGLGMVAYAAGYAYHLALPHGLEGPPYPSLGDGFRLTFHGASLVAVMLLLHSRVAGFGAGAWIDALIGGLTLAAIGATLLDPILMNTGGSLAAVSTNLAYPLSDVLIIGLIAPVFALSGWRAGRSWWLIGAAWTCQLVADTIYLFETTNGGYSHGTLADVTSPAMMLLLSYAAWRTHERRAKARFAGWPVVAVPAVFVATALGLISFVRVNHVAVVLATFVLVLAVARMATSFADVRSLARIEDLLTRLEHILRSAGEGIYGLDQDGRAVFANRAAAEMTGHDEKELLGADVHELVHHTKPDGTPYPPDDCPVRRSLQNGSVERVSDELYFRKDGTSFPVEYTSTPIHEGQQVKGAVVVFKDVSERLQGERERAELERRLQRSQRMESIGQLAGGIAHDFNNLLGVIINYASFVRDELPEGTPIHHDVGQICSASERAAALTRQLLVFGGRDVSLPETLDMNAVVGGMRQLLDRTLGEDIALQLSFEAGLPPVVADRSQLEQIVLNLAVNARDAMPTGGTLAIETRSVGPSAEVAGGGRCVSLRVADTGCGMPEDVAARAFEPFFTTKTKDKGSGLGLATVYGIVAGAGGELELDSKPGVGTVVEVKLPCAASLPEPSPSESRDRRSRSMQGEETILLVEDEHGVRELTRRILAKHRHEVLSAGSPSEALHLFANHEWPIDLLLTDVVLPEMSGRELAERVRARQPSMAVAYMSGYHEEIVTRHGVREPGIPLLQKPFDTDALLGVVQEALRRKEQDERAES